MKTLITGVCGFVGQHLLKFLTDNKCRPESSVCAAGRQDRPEHIVGIDLKEKWDRRIDIFAGSGPFFTDTVKSPSVPQNENSFKFEYIQADLTDKNRVDEVISFFKPDRIYHLAAQASVKYSWANPVETFQTNVFGGIYLLEALKIHCPDCKMLIACTAEEYGKVENGSSEPIKEDFKIGPSNPYAISKAALDFFASVFQKINNLNIFISRSFNHIGPGQSDNFVAADFAKQIAEIEKGLRQPILYVGNIDVYRDFLDVRDVVRAYDCIVQKGGPGQAYNVCSGKKRKISEILDILIKLSSNKNISIKVDDTKLRPIDFNLIYGDNSKLRQETGWEPLIDIARSLNDILNWWRERSVPD